MFQLLSSFLLLRHVWLDSWELISIKAGVTLRTHSPHRSRVQFMSSEFLQTNCTEVKVGVLGPNITQ